MALPGRNDPCPCLSGKKYKKCCLAADEERERQRFAAAREAALSPVFVDDDNLDELSNGVLDLLYAGRLDEALQACAVLRDAHPDCIDWLDRSALVHEARGEFPLALDFTKRALAFTEDPDVRDGFEEAGRDDLRARIAKLAAKVTGAM